jgi:F0F1-type ATP synthase delta subunit
LLEAVANVNGLQLLQAEDRKELVAALEQLERSAPRIHVSFAIEATPAFTAKIVGWLRANIDPRVLLEVGLQPSIAAGCVLRTNNKVFDFSLRQHFAEAQGLLSASLTATTSESTQVAVPEAPHE